MHEQTTDTTPTTLEERMRAALDRLVAATPTATERTICRTVRSGGHLGKGFDFTATIDNNYGFGETLDEAVQEAVKRYGTADKRRAQAIDRIKSEAESLGLTVIEPASVAPAGEESSAD